MIIAPGATSVSIDIQIVDDTGLAVTGLVAATLPAISWSLAGNTAATSITLSDLAAITSAYSSGGVKERSGGYYRLDLPNSALAGAGSIKLIGDASGKHLICEPIEVRYVQGDLRQAGGSNITSAGGIIDVKLHLTSTSDGKTLLTSGVGTDQLQVNNGGATVYGLLDSENAGGVYAFGLNGGVFGLFNTGSQTISLPVSGDIDALAASLDNVNTNVLAITTNTARARIICPDFLVRPSSGSSTFAIAVHLYSLQGLMEDADSNTISIHAKNNTTNTVVDTSLSSTTMTRAGVGTYTVNFSVASTDAVGEITFTATWNIGGNPITMGFAAELQDAENLSTLNAIKTVTDKILFDGSGFVKTNPQTAVTLAAGSIVTATFGAGATLPRVTLVDTATNLTNLPSIPANWITAAVINAGALNGKGDWMLSGTKVVLNATQTDYPPAKAGDAMALTTGERTATANVVDTILSGDHGGGAWGGSGGDNGGGTVTFVQAAAAIGVPLPDAGDIGCLRGDSLTQQLTALGSLTGRTKLYFTVKSDPVDSVPDSAATIQIEATAGLAVLNGAAPATGSGTLAVSDSSTGTITITLDAIATSQLAAGQYSYDVQLDISGTVTTLATGKFIVQSDVTRATD